MQKQLGYTGFATRVQAHPPLPHRHAAAAENLRFSAAKPLRGFAVSSFA
jgi:hypothetical protein